jgi:hypothetical protein
MSATPDLAFHPLNQVDFYLNRFDLFEMGFIRGDSLAVKTCAVQISLANTGGYGNPTPIQLISAVKKIFRRYGCYHHNG